MVDHGHVTWSKVVHFGLYFLASCWSLRIRDAREMQQGGKKEKPLAKVLIFLDLLDPLSWALRGSDTRLIP